VHPLSWSSEEVSLLEKQLTKRRKVLARHWTDDTIYPSFKATKTADQPASHGQCGVSSAWVLNWLSESWRSAAYYCVGDVQFSADERDVAKFHCWVEIGDESSTRRLVIDLTCDQFQAFRGVSVLIREHGSLMGRSIEYKASSRRRFEELHGDSVWARFEILEDAMRWPWLKTLYRLPRRAVPFGSRRDRRVESVVESPVGSQSTEASAA